MSRPTLSTLLHASMLVTIGNVCAYLIQLVLARSLSPADFGAANAIVALSITLVAPFAVAPMVISRLLIEHENAPEVQRGIIRRLTGGSLVLGIVIWLCHLPFGDIVSSRLQVGPEVSNILLPLIVVSTMLFHIPIGIWQGKRAYLAMSAGTAAVPILRFIFVAMLVVLAGGGLDAALWSFIAGGAIVFVWGTWALRDLHAKPTAAPPLETLGETIAFAVPASLATLGMLGLASIDQPLVRALSTPEISGQYSAASTLAKICFLLPSAITAIVFPEALKLTRQEGAASQASLRLISTTLSLTFLIGGAASLAMIVAPNTILVVLVGNSYGEAALYLRLLAPAMTCLAIANVLVTYALARNRLEILVAPLAALVVAAVMPPLFRLDAIETAALMLIVMVALCAACLIWLFVTHRPSGKSGLSS